MTAKALSFRSPESHSQPFTTAEAPSLALIPGGAPPGATWLGASAVPPMPLAQFKQNAEYWVMDCEFRRMSPQTIEFRRHVVEKMVWYWERQRIPHCDHGACRLFLTYVANGHQEPGGRWGNPQMKKPVADSTLHRYYRELRSLCGWLVDKGLAPGNYCTGIKPPQLTEDQIQPLSIEQIQALIDAAAKSGPKKSAATKRNVVIMLMLFDCGMRVSELCNIKRSDISLAERSIAIEGKGKKKRCNYFSDVSGRALIDLLRMDPREPDEYLFQNYTGRAAGEKMDRSGVLQLVRRLGKKAGITGVRCSPHTIRHSYATEMLRNGAHLFAVQDSLGHESMKMTRRYAKVAQSDLKAQHRMASPADRLKKR